MTSVRLGIVRDTPTGLMLLSQGVVVLEPHHRRLIDGTVMDVAPGQAYRVELCPTTPAPVVTLEPGPWWVDELVPAGARRLVMVPADTGAVIDYATLSSIDPATLEPTPEALEGWTATITEVRGLRDETRDTALLVHGVAQAADASATAAELWAGAAGQHAATAAGAAGEATGARNEAALHAAAAYDIYQDTIGVRIIIAGPMGGDPA